MNITNTKTRVNITLSQEDKEFLDTLAEYDGVPPTTKAAELLRDALELQEDIALEKLALERDRPGVKYITHDEFWKQVLQD